MFKSVIQKDHELICSGCGCVVGEINDDQGIKGDVSNIETSSANLIFLGSALSKSKKYASKLPAEEYYQEQTFQKLLNVCKKYGLPDLIAIETLKELKRKNRGFRSEREPIKQMLKILQKDDYYLYIHKYRAIKSRYEQDFSS